MNLRTKSVGIALTMVLLTARLGSSSAQDPSSSASLAARRGALAESVLAAKERALGEPFAASIRANLKSRMEALSMEQLEALAQQGESADLPTVLGSVTSDLVYTPVTPCRVFDSRVSQGGPGPIPANTQRNVFVAGTVGFPAQGGFSGGCGVPVGATSAIINFVAVSPAGAGNIRAWAVANPQPAAPLAAVLNYGTVAGLPAIANGVAVPLCDPTATSCTLGDLRLQADTSATNILGDVVGYFGPAAGLVTSVNSIAGPVTIAAGANIAVTTSGSTVTIANTAPVNSGTVTSVATGAGLSGGPITASGTLTVATGGIVSGMVANGAIGAAQINQAQVQTRLAAMCPAGQFLRGVNVDGSIVCETVFVPPTITTVDGPANLGGSTSLAIGADGFPVISYYDNTAGALKVAKCVNAACAGVSTITTVDDPVNILGWFTSLAIGADGFPVISYQDVTAGALKVAKCVTAACTGVSTITTVDDPSVNVVGSESSIEIGADGFPVISYRDGSAGALKVAKCVNAACTGVSTISTVDDPPVNFVGQYTSIAIGADGLPVISYQDGSAGALKVAKCVNAACTGTSIITTVDDPVNNVGYYTSIAVGAEGFPVISHGELTTGTLKVAKCVNAACTGVSTITTVDDPASFVGYHSSIAVGAEGFPVISYQDASAGALKVAKCVNAACTGVSTIGTVDDPPVNFVGRYTSIAIGADGLPVISYYDQTAFSLKVVKCSKTNCVP